MQSPPPVQHSYSHPNLHPILRLHIGKALNTHLCQIKHKITIKEQNAVPEQLFLCLVNADNTM